MDLYIPWAMDALLRLEFNNDAHCLCGGSIYFFNFGSLRVHRVIIVNWASSFWREDWSQEKKEEEEMRTWDINWDPLIARSQSLVSKQFGKISLTNSFLKLFFVYLFCFLFPSEISLKHYMRHNIVWQRVNRSVTEETSSIWNKSRANVVGLKAHFIFSPGVSAWRL